MELLRIVDRMLAALDGSTDGVFDIEMGTKYWAGSMNKYFPESSAPNDTRKVKVTFKGTTVSAVLDSLLGMTSRVYTGELPSDIDAAKVKELQTGRWTLDALEVERKGTDASSPLWRHLYYSCAGVKFSMSHELSGVERA